MFTCETLTGIPYEMGLQEGRIFRHVIRRSRGQYNQEVAF